MESTAKPALAVDREARSNPDARGNTLICAAPVVEQESASTRPLPSLGYLIVVRGGIPGTMYKLPKGTCTLGRSAENTIPLHEGTVSRRHAQIAHDSSGTPFVTDVGSSNGTYVDGRRILAHRPVRISDGGRIQVGAAVLVKYVKLDPCDAGFQHEMFERSVRDNLTGLYNRTYFLSQVSPLADTNASRGRGLAVIMLDIDHFKKVNDTYGHDIGDRVLRHVGDVLRDSTRAEDLVARYGGEEFVIALPCNSVDQAIERAERIRGNLADRCINTGSRDFRVTASLGLAFNPPGRRRDLAQLISSADEALYLAKRGGRNRVICSSRVAEEGVSKTESAEGFTVL